MDKTTTIEPSHANAPTALKTATQQPGDGYLTFTQSTKDNFLTGGCIIAAALLVYVLYTRYFRA